jgi:hypothetical protein
MPSFAAPASLLGLLAIAVPVFVHLMHRERRQAQRFPSLMFLRRVPFRSVRRQKLRHLLLFAARCLAFTLVALAFARPFFSERGRAVVAASGARACVILLDRSYSMGYGDHFARATAAARRALQGLSPGDEAGLVLFSDRAEGVVPLTNQHRDVLAALQLARPSSSTTRFTPPLKLAQDWLEAAGPPRREVVLITDCQKRGAAGLEEVRLPQGTALEVVTVAQADANNAAISGVSFDRELRDGRERIAATARVTHTGGGELRRRVALEIAGRVVSEKTVALPGNGATTVSFDAVPYPAGVARGRVLLSDDALAADNVFQFALETGQELPVLIVEDAGAGLFLRRALAIGDRPRFRVQSKAVLQPADLAGQALVIFAGGAPPDEATAKALSEFVRGGGGLLVSLVGGGWRGAAAALVPQVGAAPTDRTSDRGATLAWLDYDHPALELFKLPHSGDFSGARFLRYRSPKNAIDWRPLMKLDDGSVLLAERQEGQGRLLAWSAGFDGLTNNLALQPVFLPLLHQLMRSAAGRQDRPLFHTVGEVLELEARGATPSVTTPSGERLRLDKGRLQVELREAGFYEIQRQGEPDRSVAVNVDSAESDLSALDPEELQSALQQRAAPRAGQGSGPATPEDAERRQSLWWYLLSLAFLLLLAETALSNRLSVGTTTS